MPSFPAEIGDVLRAEDALGEVGAELIRRARGDAPDPRFSPIVDSLLDLMDVLDPSAEAVRG